MMRSLWTAATGMISQQTNVDTISNNLANINTTGYKKESVQFKSLLYQTLQEKSTNADGTEKPVGIQTGLGVRNSAIVSQFTQGTTQQTGNDYDFAIQGNGFFRVQTADGSIGYTRNGSFGLSMGTNGLMLATSEGYPVLDTTGAPIIFDPDIDAQSIKIDESGNIEYPDENGNTKSVQISLVQFNNPAGLEKTADSILKDTPASGTPRLESEDANLKKSVIKKGYLEGSNVQAVNEMVDLIVAQRAYEMNSKTITAADEMLQQANNLRR
ncbi:flagellar basal-body rod protein FlgG [Anaerocolumna sp. AGMB13025]|uniref:flagellar basal-body rod protein FlgG n=1 Tax=Anaerocolumna sp. AGMB13025 TaxID=3039116 RepID=UPI00241F4B1B|nr:flagellar basal-body rod protein FlgG [Anaerocolumna sp. AGMB13025]WFR57813.1 flagellar basal-body rod protein FlgG [Anaerocolumna sp. AGMB13025]